jgi:hypothetical protein
MVDWHNYVHTQFSTDKRSILPVGDITETISDEKADIAVLEEPEHLTWYHHGRRWKNKFRKVIGIVHTNYLEYVKRERNGYLQAFLLKYINSWVTDIYCHKVSSLILYIMFTSHFNSSFWLSISTQLVLYKLLIFQFQWAGFNMDSIHDTTMFDSYCLARGCLTCYAEY